MSSSFPELVFSDQEDFNADRLNAAMEVLDQRLRSLEPFSPQWEAAVNELRLFGLARLNETILPAYERVQKMASLGFLMAQSSTSVTLAVNAEITFTISGDDNRDLFTPAPFVVITREANTTDYAVGRRLSYDPDTGALLVKIVAFYGNAGPFTDWWIAATAGSQLAANAAMSQIEAARADAYASRVSASADSSKTAADRVQVAADAAAALASRLAAAVSEDNAKLWDPTRYSTTQQVQAAINLAIENLVAGAPDALNTLKELSDKLATDETFAAGLATSVNDLLSNAFMKTGGTITGNLTMDKAGVSDRSIVGMVSSKKRWQVSLGDGSAETGSNAGSAFAISRFDDAGNALGTIMKIDRTNGRATFGETVVANNGRLWGESDFTLPVTSLRMSANTDAGLAYNGVMIEYVGNAFVSGCVMQTNNVLSHLRYRSVQYLIGGTWYTATT